MKKFLALMMVAIMALTCVSSAFAAEYRRFNISTDSIDIFQIGVANITKTGNTWHISVDEGASNLSETHRAVTRVHKGYDSASSTWVYSGQNYTRHPYKTAFLGKQSGISYRGRLDNRDTGWLEFHGNFYYNQ